MSNILTQSQAFQGSSAPTIFSNQFETGGTYQSSSSACIVDLTPPTFAGINFLDVESRGQIRAAWAAATDATAPIRYEVYIRANTSVGLFSTANIVALTPNLQFDIFTMPDGSFLENGSTYYVGVRAIDGVSNRDNNTVIMSVISTGELTSIDVYRNEGVFSITDTGMFLASLWSTKNESQAVAPDAILGTASYQVYDSSGNAISGMSQTGITPNGNGIYIITPVANQLAESERHYTVKVTISVDGENRVNFLPIEDNRATHTLDAVIGINTNNEFFGSFWALENGVVTTHDLGLGSYQGYDAQGNILAPFFQNNISPTVGGFWVPTPVPVTLDTSVPYLIKISAPVHGKIRSKYVTVTPSPVSYTCKATFSINASNQLEATFWVTQNDELVDVAKLGTASYQIYDKNGNTVAGLTQSGIAPDVTGMFHSTPISAALLTDLTHYTAKITIIVAGQSRTVIKGFTLLGT